MPARSTRVWLWTARTGMALIVLAGIHMIAQHFVVDEIGGLRTYQPVLDYIANPVMLVIEYAFLVTVVAHAMLGLRGILLDFGLSPRARRRVEWSSGCCCSRRTSGVARTPTGGRGRIVVSRAGPACFYRCAPGTGRTTVRGKGEVAMLRPTPHISCRSTPPGGE